MNLIHDQKRDAFEPLRLIPEQGIGFFRGRNNDIIPPKVLILLVRVACCDTNRDAFSGKIIIFLRSKGF